MTKPEHVDGEPIKVDPSVTLDMIMTGGRQIALVVGGGVSLYSFLKSHDLSGLGGWIGSDLFTILGALGAIAAFVYGQWRTFWRKREQVLTANSAPDKVAIVQAGHFTRFVYRIFGKEI